MKIFDCLDSDFKGVARLIIRTIAKSRLLIRFMIHTSSLVKPKNVCLSGFYKIDTSKN